MDFANNRGQTANIVGTTDPVRDVLDGKVEAETYVFASGVQREQSTLASDGWNVGWIDTNDYLEYTLTVLEAGNYTINYQVAAESVAGEIKLYGKSALPLTTTSLPITGGWQIWQSVTSDVFYLSEGIYTFRIRASIGGFNLDYFEFNKKVD